MINLCLFIFVVRRCAFHPKPRHDDARPRRSAGKPSHPDGKPSRPNGKPSHPDGKPSRPDGKPRHLCSIVGEASKLCVCALKLCVRALVAKLGSFTHYHLPHYTRAHIRKPKSENSLHPLHLLHLTGCNGCKGCNHFSCFAFLYTCVRPVLVVPTKKIYKKCNAAKLFSRNVWQYQSFYLLLQQTFNKNE